MSGFGLWGAEPKPRGPDSFLDWRVRVFVPPVLLGLAWLCHVSPFQWLMRGFHVWTHEFGHAVCAWMCGWKATPLPTGWTNVEPGVSPVVYVCLLILFALLVRSGWREGLPGVIAFSIGAATAQAWLTWRLPEATQEMIRVAGGLGGEFVLSALLMAAFYLRLPEWFRWGGCRYVFFFIGAVGLIMSTLFWRDVYHGVEEIPYGSMIHGGDDANGDMNRLVDDYGWKEADIRNRFQLISVGCWWGLAGVYVWFAARVDRAFAWAARALRGGAEVSV